MKKTIGAVITLIATLVVTMAGCKDKMTTPKPTTKSLSVSGRLAWQDTGVDVKAGDAITIAASGSIIFDSSGRSSTPDGLSTFATPGANGCTYLVCNSSIRTQSLVGRIGSSSLSNSTTGFYVGSSFSGTANAAGRLYLGFNDGFVKTDRSDLDDGAVRDNEGSFSVTITVTQ